MGQWWNDTDRGKLKYWEKNLSECHTLLGDERPAANRQSNGTAVKSKINLNYKDPVRTAQ
jgi:hypothetical protein